MPPSRRSARTVSSTFARQSAQPYTRANTRSGSPSAQPSTASLSRSPVPSGKQSLKLTVKAAPSKLRQATSGSSIPPNPYAADNPSESDATPVPASRVARSTRNPRTVVDNDSDDDEDMDVDAEGENDEDDEDAGGDEVDQEILGNEGSEDDAEGEEDEDMDDHPPPPIIKQSKPPGQTKPNVTVTAPPSNGPLKSVEAKEAEDDDELSDLESADEENELMDDDENEIGNEDDEEDVDDDDEEDSDPDNSRSATPDLSKLTRRQRGAFEEDANLMALSNEAQKKKHLSVEEHNMRRQEMARRRKNLSDKRNEEEKMDTINKLLSKPAPKRRTRAEILASQLHGANPGTPGVEDGEEELQPRAEPVFTRWVSSAEGCRVGVPEEWLEGPSGEVFGGESGGGGRMMVEEVA